MIDTTRSAATTSQDTLEDLRTKILRDISTREEWMRRQAVWYAMRHDGLRRRNKPWPDAADLHDPLADGMIERLKPFYFNQLFATETIASFIATSEELKPFAADIGNWFDYKCKQESNLEEEILTAIDLMLMAGHDVVKVLWDTESKEFPDGRLGFDAVDPSHCIVPQWTKKLQDADRVTIVQIISIEQYKRDDRFTNKSEEFITSIAGKGNSQDGENTTEDQLKIRREGLTYSTSDDEIIYWEVWENTPEGWEVHFISPNTDAPLRPSMMNPFKHGRLPMVRFQTEVKDKGHYSSRGIPERVGAFEKASCKQWNEKTDYMTLCLRPIFTTEQAIPNAGNLRLIPGQIISGGLSAVQMPPIPPAFDEERDRQHAAAEQLVGMPDFGQNREQDPKDPRTAAEIHLVGGLMSISIDLRARTFRSSLGELYSLAYQTLLQYDKGTQFIVQQDMQTLDPQVLQMLAEQPDGLKVTPNGSGDSWNKQAMLQKAVARKQMFQGDPFINQAELDKSILALDDPRLIPILFQDPNAKAKNEADDEAKEIPSMMYGYPIQVLPGQDHATRIVTLAQFMAAQGHLGLPPDPIGMQTVSAHMQQHIQALQQTNPKAVPQVEAQVQQILQAHSAGGAGGAAPTSSPNGTGAGPGGAPGQNPPKESISINYKDAPPTIRRQMELAAGFRPATDDPMEAEMHQASNEHTAKMIDAARPQPEPSVNGHSQS